MASPSRASFMSEIKKVCPWLFHKFLFFSLALTLCRKSFGTYFQVQSNLSYPKYSIIWTFQVKIYLFCCSFCDFTPRIMHLCISRFRKTRRFHLKLQFLITVGTKFMFSALEDGKTMSRNIHVFGLEWKYWAVSLLDSVR